MELDVAEGLAGAAQGDLALGGAVRVVEAAAGVRRLAILRRSQVVSAASRRRRLGLNSGVLKWSSSKISLGLGS